MELLLLGIILGLGVLAIVGVRQEKTPRALGGPAGRVHFLGEIRRNMTSGSFGLAETLAGVTQACTASKENPACDWPYPGFVEC